MPGDDIQPGIDRVEAAVDGIEPAVDGLEAPVGPADARAEALLECVHVVGELFPGDLIGHAWSSMRVARARRGACGVPDEIAQCGGPFRLRCRGLSQYLRGEGAPRWQKLRPVTRGSFLGEQRAKLYREVWQ